MARITSHSKGAKVIGDRQGYYGERGEIVRIEKIAGRDVYWVKWENIDENPDNSSGFSFDSLKLCSGKTF